MINGKMNLVKELYSIEEKKPTRDGFGQGLLEAGRENPNVWAITADVSGSVRTNWFAKEFPSRFVQVGVAEQNMAGVAAGIAACEKTVVAAAFGVFSPGRNWDQIRVSVCYNDVPVIFHGSHTGLTVGPDGASHQALEDMAITRVLPNMCVVAPSDVIQAKKAIKALIKRGKPAYMRTEREKAPIFTTEETPFEIGKANVYREGKDVAIFACGFPVYESLKTAAELEKEGISCAVIDCHTIKPIDKEVIKEWGGKTGLIVSIEEHQVDGGLGGAIAEVLSEEGIKAKLKRHGVYNRFCESGSAKELMKKYGLDSEGIKKVVKEAINNK